MPIQIRRLLVIFVIIMTSFLVFRKLMISENFGEFGHYPPAAVDSLMSQEMKYAGHNSCNDCHDDIVDIKKASQHINVNCEACHGPALDHVASFEGDETILPFAPRERGYCPLCHKYDPAKPTGFPQIDPIMHNPGKPCIKCHDPHAPDPPSVPGQCSACHQGIARTKALSPHSVLECTQCHITPEEHRSNPHMARAGKPSTRADCGFCHSDMADSDKSIPRIDLDIHGEGYICWQCHYPHFPRVKL